MSKGTDIGIAKLRLINRLPFFGVLAFNLHCIEDNNVPTLGVDGETLFYNKKFWDSLTLEAQLGVLCHEVGHLFLGHVWRRGNRDAMAGDPTSGQSAWLFNLAGDIVINHMIEQFKQLNFKKPDGSEASLSDYISLPGNYLRRANYKGESTEEVYDLLLKEISKMSKQQQQEFIKNGGAFCDTSKWDDGKGKGDKKHQHQTSAKTQAKWNNLGKQALEAQRQRGTLPTYLQRLFEDLEPKEDWRRVLQNYVQPFRNNYSWNPPDRRFMDEDFRLPDIQQGEQIDWIAIAIDTSGSIGQEEMSAFIGEVKGILASYDSVKVKLTFCDADATPFVELTEFDASKIKPSGGGGTMFEPVFDLIAKEETEPLLLLYFTDLEGSFPSKQPDYDTVWVCHTNNQQVPFGTVLPYKL